MTKEEQQAFNDFADKKHVKSNSNNLRRITIRVTPEEFTHIHCLASAFNSTVSETIRQLCSGATLRAIPPVMYYDLIDQLKNIEIGLTVYCRNNDDTSELMNSFRKLTEDFKKSLLDFYDGIDGVAYRSCDEDSAWVELSEDERRAWDGEV